jgi:hypothetical protein
LDSDGFVDSDDLIKIRENRLFYAWPSVHSQMPLIFDNGYIMETVGCRCSICDGLIYGEHLHGQLHKVPGGDFRLTAFGLCIDCDTLTPFLLHMRQTEEGDVYLQPIVRETPVPIGGAEIIPFDKELRKNGKKSKR